MQGQLHHHRPGAIIIAAVVIMELITNRQIITTQPAIITQLITITQHSITTRAIIVIPIHPEAIAKSAMNVVCEGTLTILPVAEGADSASCSTVKRQRAANNCAHF